MLRRLIVVSALALTGCAGPGVDPKTAAKAGQELVTQLQGTQAALADAQGQLAAAKQQIAATGTDQARQILALQQQVEAIKTQAATRPADSDLAGELAAIKKQMGLLAAQPGSGVDVKAIEIMGKFTDALGKLQAVEDKLATTAQQYADQVKNARNPDDVRAAQATAAGQAGAAVANQFPGTGNLVAIGINLATLLLADFYRRRANATAAAGQSSVDAVQAALATGVLVAKPGAAGLVDSVIDDHPVSNRLTDVVKAATVGANVGGGA